MLSAIPQLPEIGPFLLRRLTKQYEPDHIWIFGLEVGGDFRRGGCGRGHRAEIVSPPASVPADARRADGIRPARRAAGQRRYQIFRTRGIRARRDRIVLRDLRRASGGPLRILVRVFDHCTGAADRDRACASCWRRACPNCGCPSSTTSPLGGSIGRWFRSPRWLSGRGSSRPSSTISVCRSRSISPPASC